MGYATIATEEVRVYLENSYATNFCVLCHGPDRFSVSRNAEGANKVLWASCPVQLAHKAEHEMADNGYFYS